MSKTILTAILAALIAGLVVYFVTNDDDGETDVYVTIESIKNIAELAVVEYTLSEALERTLPKEFGNIKEAKFIVHMKGVIKGAVNLTKAKYDINEENKTATITFAKKAVVINNPSFDSKDIRFTTCKDRLLNKIKDSHRNKAIDAAIAAMKKTAKDTGIENKVKKETKILLERYLRSFGYTPKVIFK